MTRFSSGITSVLALLALGGCAAARPAVAEAPVASGMRHESASAVSLGGSPGVAFAADSVDGEMAPAAPPAPPPGPMGYPQQMPTATTPSEKPAPPAGPTAEVPSKQHLVYTADFTLAVYQVEQGLDRTEAIARELGGYLSMRGDHEITVRVPRERFREALAQVEKIGDVVHRDVKAIDVTDEFVDTESRLKNARVMRDRLQALLQKAAVKEAIEIEKELGRVTEQIEVLEGKMKMLSDRIAFSTITVHYAAKGGGNSRPSFQLPFAWVRTLGVHRLLNFQPRPQAE